MKMTHIDIPMEFNRNNPKVRTISVEETGLALIKLACEETGISDLSDKDILDVGCGTRFTQTIINRDLLIKSYTGIDVSRRVIDYLDSNIQDSRFAFYYWHLYNKAYNIHGKKLTKKMKLPIPSGKKFDCVWLFSVITHLDPSDAENMLYILRKYVKEDGFLYFSAFIDNKIDSFEDKYKDQPRRLFAQYNENFMRRILSKTGWQVVSMYGPQQFITYHFVCSPNSGL